MTVDKIKIGKSIEVYGLWQRLDLEVTADPNQSPEDAYKEAKELLDKLLPGVDREERPVEEKKEMTQEDALIATIGYSMSLPILERFRGQVERMKNEQVTVAFEKRFAELNK